jgi:hypothetical protein
MTFDRFPHLLIGAIATLPLMACSAPRAVSSPSPATVAPTATTNRTVSEYFVQAPEQYFKILDRDSVGGDVRQKLLQTQPRTGTPIVDTANGYVRTPSLSPDMCAYEMAIFRRSRGSHLVALNVTCTMGDTLTILDPDRDWQDVTATLFPIQLTPSPEETIRLPRQGRTIAVMGENNQPIAQVKFDNDRFVVVK